MVTRRVRRLLLLGTLLGCLVGGIPAVAAEESGSLDRRLLEVSRRDLPLAARLKSASRALASREALDPELAVRAGTALLPAALEPAGWLILRGLDTGFVSREIRVAGREAVREAFAAAPADAAAIRATLAALGLSLGARDEAFAGAVTAQWPAGDFVQAVLRRELGTLRTASGALLLGTDADAIRTALETTRASAVLLDDATEDEPQRMRAGLDGLLAAKDEALPLLLHEAEQGAAGSPAGRMPRAARAILALGMMKDRRATPVLARCLTSTDGWVRVAAATALGDSEDPAAAVPLAVHLATLGDLFRARDQWDYPGASETTVPEADWRRVDYFAVDCAAADSLLRLGVPNAAGYLIHEKLDPSKSNSRIRVFQDAVDALRRSMPQLKASTYNVDAGLPQRDATFTVLAMRWRRMRDSLEPAPLEQDPGFSKAARALAEKLRGTDVRTFMITKPACALLGRAMTPTLIETLAEATKGSAHVALSETLGLVRDPRAIDPLLAELRDKRPFVRARAAEALGVYVQDERARKALIETLRDAKAGPRVSALKALVGAPQDAAVLAAVKANEPKTPSKDWAMARTAVLLVQEGAAHWAPFEEGLGSEQRYVREAWWRMLRTALDWPAHMHDAKSKPDVPHVRRVTKAVALARLAARRME